jgi:2-desacetyl-2-hydroxyethyl bacteriochlorophyllide A dehydrogenase
MKALTFQGMESVGHETVPDPRIEDPGDVVVRVECAGICGSDLHVYHGRETGLDLGTVMGHEFVGEIVEAGAEVRGIVAGDRVVSPFTTSCGRCFYCSRGLTARCAAGRLFGWVEHGVGLHGCQAEYVRVPLAGSTLVKVPEGISAEPALFAGDVLSTGYFCADLAGIEPGSVVVVLGCGPVGLMAAIGAQDLNAGRVFAVDAVAERLELAKRFGAEPLDLASDPVSAVLEATEGRGADAVLEVVGSPEATRLAVDLVRPGGSIAAAGVHTERHFAFSPVEAYDKNLTYRAGRCPARHYMERVLPIVESEKYDLASVISHRLPLAEGARGYDIFARKLDGCTKVILTPPGGSSAARQS